MLTELFLLLTRICGGRDAVAKRRGGKNNKSQAIRDYLATHRRAAGKEVVDALGAQGIKVTTQLVSNVRTRSKMRRGRRKGGPRRGPGRPAAAKVSVATLLEAKKLVDKTGSIAAVRQALAALERLR
jgi:hypothetical protein